MANGKIDKYDLISKNAIKTWDDFLKLLKTTETQLEKLVEIGPALDRSIKGSKSISNVSSNIDSITKSIEKLIDAQKKLDTLNRSVLNLNKKKIQADKEAAQAAEKATKEAELRAQREARAAEKAAKAAERLAQRQEAAAKKASLVAEREAQKMATANEKAALKSAAAMKKFDDEIDAYAAKMHSAQKPTSSFSSIFGGIVKSMTTFIASYVTFNLAMNAFGSIVNSTKKLDALDFAIKKVITDQQELVQSQNFLNDIVQRYGTNLFDTTNSYIKFRAATKATNLTVKESQSIFESFTKVSSVLGLSAENTNLVFLALEQMISKGKITTEELRRQLGEHIPGAFQIMANAIGVTVPELDKMLKKSQLLSEDALPKFAAELEKTFGIENVTRVDTLVAAQERLATAWYNFVKNLNLTDTLKKAYDDIALFLQKISDSMKPDRLKVTERSADLVQGVVSKLEGVNDEEKRRNILMEGYNKLIADRQRTQHILVEDEKKLPGFITKTLQYLNRGLGFNESFWKDLKFEEVYKDTVLDDKAYKDAIDTILQQWDKFSKVPAAKKTPVQTETDQQWKKRLITFKNNLDEEYNMFAESQQDLRRVAYNKARDEGADEVKLSEIDAGLKMDMDKKLFSFRSAQMDKLLEYEKGHQADIDSTNKEYSALRKNYAKDVADFLINEDERAYREHIKNLQRIKDADIGAINDKMNQALYEEQVKLTQQVSQVRGFAGIGVDYKMEKLYSDSLMNQLNITKKYQEDLLTVENLTADEIKNIQKSIFDTDKAIEEAKRAEAEKTLKKKVELEQAWMAYAENAIGKVFSIFSNFQKSQMDILDVNYEHEKNLAGDNVAKKIAADNKYAEEKAKLQRRQAISEKISGIFSVLIDTAKGIMDAASKVVTIPLIPFIAGLGALEAGAIAATPIPSYKSGGKHDGGIAIFSEEGPELFIPDSGKPILTPTTETIADMPRGKFIPHEETSRILADKSMSMFVNDILDIDLSKTNGILSLIADKESVTYINRRKFVKRKNINGNYATWN